MKKLGLVLEGGGAKCAYQNGVLAVLEAIIIIAKSIA